jgi:hypothetical protein
MRNLWRVVLIGVLCMALATPGRAESINAAGDQLIIGIVVVSAAIGVGITLLILHHKHKTSTVTGCVGSGPGGMNVTDDKDKRVYALSGNPPGLKAGDRMTLEGRRKNSGTALVFEARSVTKDLGACPP